MYTSSSGITTVYCLFDNSGLTRVNAMRIAGTKTTLLSKNTH